MMVGSGEADTATAEGIFSHVQINLLFSNPDSVNVRTDIGSYI